jgi:hypothetical protein
VHHSRTDDADTAGSAQTDDRAFDRRVTIGSDQQ